MMVKKDKWITYPDVAREIEKLIIAGVPAEKINGSMIWDGLKFGSRHSAYKFLEEWRAQRKSKPKLPPFAMSDDMRDRFVTTIGDMMGEALLSERQSLAAAAEAKDVKIAILKESVDALMESLAVTEGERDTALVQLEEESIAKTDLMGQLAKQEAAIDALKEEYNRLFDRVAEPGGAPPQRDWIND